jgi:hypothetical protein
MKKTVTVLRNIWMLFAILGIFLPSIAGAQALEKYYVLAWNDLGMHCANQNFNNMCILPPYNNQHAQVIKQGSSTRAPQVLDAKTSGVRVTYSIPGNTWSGSTTELRKTDFWKYAYTLFGVNLAPNVGLTGAGLAGTMLPGTNYYYVNGIPVTPLPDNALTTPDPYQLTLVTALDAANNVLATTRSVIPVSNEINCVSSGCHKSEMDILYKHDKMTGFDPNKRPIFCANCHADNALGMPGKREVKSFSAAIHLKHAELTNDCYKCHPGPKTKCYRDVMHAKGITCQKCHGSVLNVGKSIDEYGRRPWIDEPKCGSSGCHGARYAEEPGKLFRESKGHGGLYCSACHGSPHAILPSENPRDNIQNIAIQGYAGTLQKCEVCHGYNPGYGGPHSTAKSSPAPDGANQATAKSAILNIAPNPASEDLTVFYHNSQDGLVRIRLYDLQGKIVRTLADENQPGGDQQIKAVVSDLVHGTYVCTLESGGTISTRKLIIAR